MNGTLSNNCKNEIIKMTLGEVLHKAKMATNTLNGNSSSHQDMEKKIWESKTVKKISVNT